MYSFVSEPVFIKFLSRGVGGEGGPPFVNGNAPDPSRHLAAYPPQSTVFVRNVAVQWFGILLRIREILGSNFDRRWAILTGLCARTSGPTLSWYIHSYYRNVRLYWTQNICEPALRHSETGWEDGKGKGEEQDAICAIASLPSPYLGWLPPQRVCSRTPPIRPPPAPLRLICPFFLFFPHDSWFLWIPYSVTVLFSY
jgi:hypothetical protein